MRLTNRGSARGLQLISIGIAFCLCSLSGLVISFSSSPPLFVEMWLTLGGVGILAFGAGLWECRRQEECTVDIANWQAKLSVRQAFRYDEWHVNCDSLQIFSHRVELVRNGSWLPTWKGHALCLWHHEELTMVLAVSKDKNFCNTVLNDSHGVLEQLYLGDGKILIAML